MKKVIKNIIIIIIILLPIGILSIYGYIDWNKNRKINPEIFPAFRKIENYCLEYTNRQTVEPLEYKKCSKLVSIWEKYLNPQNDKLSAEEWYKIIQRLGFEQPILYLKQPATEEEYEQSIEEQKQLTEIQNKIVENQFSESIVETKKLIEDLKNN